MHGTGAFLFRAPECFANTRGNRSRRDNLSRVLGQRLHHVDHVDQLKHALFVRAYRLLAGDHQHRHRTELGVRGSGDQVGGAGA